MARNFTYFILFIYYLIYFCNCDICTPEIITGPPLPVLSKQYYARIEMVIPKMKMSTLIEEYYNYDENKFVIRNHGVNNTMTFFDMKSNEVFFINPDEGTCSKVNTSDASNNFMELFFGSVISDNSDKAHILLPTQIMNLEPSKFKRYLGKVMERGYEVNKWTFCIDHVTDLYDISGEVTWFWKVPESNWTSESNQNSFPVKAVLQGEILGKTISLTSFNIEMNYYWWSTKITEDLDRQISSYFKIPPGVACEDKKITKLFPDFARKMQLRVDLTIPSKGIISQSDDWYDFDEKIFRVTYRNIPIQATECTLYTYIYDEKKKQLFERFSDQPIGYCGRPQSVPSDYIDDTNFHKIRLVYYNNFLGTNDINKKRYSYMGERNETDILCDIWSTVRNDWPSQGVITSWEWAFSKEIISVPVKLSIRILKIESETNFFKKGEIFVLNFYEFATSDNVPDIIFDISQCFDYDKKAIAKFNLGGNLNNNIFSYELENTLLKKIAKTIGVNQLRISRLVIKFEEDPVVYFQLLDNSENDYTEINLTTAFGKLCEAVQKCQLLTTIKLKYEVWPMPNTLETTSSEEALKCTLKSTCYYEQYTADVMAGLGIAFLVLGILFGSLVLFIYMYLLGKTKLS